MVISRTATLLVSAIGILIAAGVGYVLYQGAKKRAEQQALVSVVTETTSQLRDGLKSPSPQILEKLEGNLRVARAWSNPYMADATEHYLIGAREIVRQRGEVERLQQKAAASRAALEAHMNRAARRDTPWIRVASELKKQVERDHADLDRALGTLAELLEGLPDAQKRLSPYVEASLVLDDGVRKQARQQALAEAQRASAALKEARSLAPRF
jgi:hypothetical protein